VAKIGALPGKDVIDTLAPVLDYYLWMGIPVCRKMPSYKAGQPTPTEGLAAAHFAYINQIAGQLTPDIIDAYKALASDTTFTWKDYMNNLYINASTFAEGL